MILWPAIIWTATAQDGGIQTDTIRVSRYSAGSRPVVVTNLDTSRWNASFLYLAFSLNTLTNTYQDFNEVNIGVGANIRIPIKRIDEDGEFFLRGTAAVGFFFTQYESVAGYHPSQRMYVGAGYTYVKYNGGEYEDAAFVRRHAMVLVAGVGSRKFYGEFCLLIPIAKDDVERTFWKLDELGYFTPYHSSNTVVGEVTIGIRLLLYF